MSNAEEGISKAQISAAKAQSAHADGLERHHKWNIAYLDDRIFVYLFAIAFLALLITWMTATSALVLYGSLGLVIVTTLLWGVARIKRIDRIREERAQQVQAMQSESAQND